MPKINQYVSETLASGAIGARADSTTFGDYSGLAKTGAAIQDAGTMVSQIQDRDDKLKAATMLSDANEGWAKYTDELRAKSEPGAAGHVENFSKAYDIFTDGATGKANATVMSPAIREDFGLKLKDLKVAYLKREIDFEKEKHGEFVKQTYIDKEDVAVNAIRADPSTLPIQLAVMKNLNQGIGFDGTSGAAAMEATSKRAYQAALDSNITNLETNPKTTIAAVDRELQNVLGDKYPWKAETTKAFYDESITRLQRLKKSLDGENKEIMFLDFNEWANKTTVTGNDDGKYTASWIDANVPDKVQNYKMKKIAEKVRAEGSTINYVKNTSDVDIAKKITAAEDMLPGSKNFNRDYAGTQALVSGFARRQQAWKEDQAGYTISVSDAAKSRFAAFQSDPTPETADAYANMAISEQKNLSPNSVPVLINSTELLKFKGALQSLDSETDSAPKIVSFLQKQQDVWQNNWPIVVKDLVNKNAINSGEYVAANMVGKPQYNYIAEDMVKSFRLKEDELMKQYEAPQTMKKELEGVSREVFSEFRNTLKYANDGDTIANQYQDALARYALSKNITKKRDLQDVANKILLDDYKFVDDFRIPNAKDHNTYNIERGADKAVASILNSEFEFEYPQAKGEEPAAVKQRYLSELKDGAKLVNNGDSGLRMVDQFGRQVKILKDGEYKKASWSWAELELLGTDPTTSTEMYWLGL